MAYYRCRGCSCSPTTVPLMLIAEPNTVVPTRDIRIDSSLLSPTSRFRKIIRRIRRTMNEVPETGSIPSPPSP